MNFEHCKADFPWHTHTLLLILNLEVCWTWTSLLHCELHLPQQIIYDPVIYISWHPQKKIALSYLHHFELNVFYAIWRAPQVHHSLMIKIQQCHFKIFLCAPVITTTSKPKQSRVIFKIVLRDQFIIDVWYHFVWN